MYVNRYTYLLESKVKIYLGFKTWNLEMFICEYMPSTKPLLSLYQASTEPLPIIHRASTEPLQSFYQASTEPLPNLHNVKGWIVSSTLYIIIDLGIYFQNNDWIQNYYSQKDFINKVVRYFAMNPIKVASRTEKLCVCNPKVSHRERARLYFYY